MARPKLTLGLVRELRELVRVRQSQKKARRSLDKLKARLEVQKSRLFGAVEGFKTHSNRLAPAVIEPTEADDIFRKLHDMKQTELSASAEIGEIEDEMTPVELLINQEQMVAVQVERDLRNQTTICVSTREEVYVLKKSGIGHELSVVKSAKDRSALIGYCRDLGFRPRFEPDMLACSGCYYGGGDKEMIELGAIRKRWKTLHGSNPDRERRQGKCPLTPEEVGLMLRALGEPIELRPGRGVFHENLATCVSEDTEAKEKMESDPRKLGKDATRKDVGEVVDQNDNDNEPEWSDPDDYDDTKYAQARWILSYPRSLSWKICWIEGGCSLAVVKQFLVVPK